jgi:guanine deaminase
MKKDKEKDSQKFFMQRAIELALQNIKETTGGPFAAIVVKNGEIIAEGVNSVHPHNDPTAHAEIVAIRKACEKLEDFNLADCEIYTTCEPCPMCLGAIYWARPKKIYFALGQKDAQSAGFDDSFIYDQIPIPYEQRQIPMHQLMRPESLTIFEHWKSNEKKIEY